MLCKALKNFLSGISPFLPDMLLERITGSLRGILYIHTVCTWGVARPTHCLSVRLLYAYNFGKNWTYKKAPCSIIMIHSVNNS